MKTLSVAISARIAAQLFIRKNSGIPEMTIVKASSRCGKPPAQLVVYTAPAVSRDAVDAALPVDVVLNQISFVECCVQAAAMNKQPIGVSVSDRFTYQERRQWFKSLLMCHQGFVVNGTGWIRH